MLIEGGSSGLGFYTEEEVKASIEEGFVLSEAELAERVAEGLEEYLESDIHFRIVQTKVNIVLEKYPNIDFDIDDMEAKAETLSKVRDKFNSLRELNMVLETNAINSGAYLTPNHAIWYHWKYLTDFQYEYVRAIRGFLNTTEINLIIQLRNILFKELGFSSNIFEAFGKGISGLFGFVGKSIGSATGFITESIFAPIAEGLIEGILGKDWKTKLVIIIVVIVIIAILGLIGLYYGKSYIGAKALKRATT